MCDFRNVQEYEVRYSEYVPTANNEFSTVSTNPTEHRFYYCQYILYCAQFFCTIQYISTEHTLISTGENLTNDLTLARVITRRVRNFKLVTLALYP